MVPSLVVPNLPAFGSGGIFSCLIAKENDILCVATLPHVLHEHMLDISSFSCLIIT